jgi:hypothetical protein
MTSPRRKTGRRPLDGGRVRAVGHLPKALGAWLKRYARSRRESTSQVVREAVELLRDTVEGDGESDNNQEEQQP